MAAFFVYIKCVYQDTYGTSIFSQSENRHFLRNALLPLLIYPVCQKFYNLREYVRAMKEHLLRFSCFTYVGGIYKMSCAGSIVWSAALALSFEPCACNINFIKTAHLVKLGNRLGVFLATYITPQIVKCWQTEYLRQKCISRKWTVFFRVHKYKPQVFLIYASRHKLRPPPEWQP